MAYNFLTCLRKYSASANFLRALNHINNSQKFLQFSTSKLLLKADSTPIKYSTNLAAQVPISETIGIEQKRDKNKLWYEKHVILLSLIVFLLYFCIFREENDIDQILKGEQTFHNSPKLELIDLKTKLKYCEINKLPTSELKAKIEELENEMKKFY